MSTPANFKVCPKCNAALSLAATACSVCHTSFLPVEDRRRVPTFSSSTANLTRPGEPVEGNRWVIAMILALFFGVFGVHRFYLGYTSLGAAMLGLTLVGFLTFCVGIGFVFLTAVGIWATVDLLLICFNGMRLPDGRLLR